MLGNHFSGEIGLESQTHVFLLRLILFVIQVFCCESVSEIKLEANVVIAGAQTQIRLI